MKTNYLLLNSVLLFVFLAACGCSENTNELFSSEKKLDSNQYQDDKLISTALLDLGYSDFEITEHSVIIEGDMVFNKTRIMEGLRSKSIGRGITEAISADNYNIRVLIRPSVLATNTLSEPLTQSDVESAFLTWQNSTGSGLTFTFQLGSEAEQPDIFDHDIIIAEDDDGILSSNNGWNPELEMDDDPWTNPVNLGDFISLNSNTCGYGAFPANDKPGRYISISLENMAAMGFTIDDAIGLVTHEAGHTLGFQHTNYFGEAQMTPTTDPFSIHFICGTNFVDAPSVMNPGCVHPTMLSSSDARAQTKYYPNGYEEPDVTIEPIDGIGPPTSFTVSAENFDLIGQSAYWVVMSYNLTAANGQVLCNATLDPIQIGAGLDCVDPSGKWQIDIDPGQMCTSKRRKCTKLNVKVEYRNLLEDVVDVGEASFSTQIRMVNGCSVNALNI